jgi:hypothetical protein
MLKLFFGCFGVKKERSAQEYIDYKVQESGGTESVVTELNMVRISLSKSRLIAKSFYVSMFVLLSFCASRVFVLAFFTLIACCSGLQRNFQH